MRSEHDRQSFVDEYVQAAAENPHESRSLKQIYSDADQAFDDGAATAIADGRDNNGGSQTLPDP